ncbi:hypothetical protein D082_26610 [Synechocystis sp. PCC 6714]|nr:hypothetical protein D082_26610 [Synechocystis sp. PCC 6714]
MLSQQCFKFSLLTVDGRIPPNYQDWKNSGPHQLPWAS